LQPYYFNSMISKSDVTSKAQSYFDEGYACSQSILLAFSEQFNLDERTAKLIASTFGGGMGRLRKTCGAVTGGFMVLGLKYGNTDPKDMDTKLHAYQKVRDLNKQVEEIHGTTVCREILQKWATDAEVEERRHHKIICRKMVGDVAGLVYDQLISEKNIK
jgi:C_GCAxxG_C_C family probable redox protein